MEGLKTELRKFELSVKDESGFIIGSIVKPDASNVLVFNASQSMDNLRLHSVMKLLNNTQKEYSKARTKFSSEQTNESAY